MLSTLVTNETHIMRHNFPHFHPILKDSFTILFSVKRQNNDTLTTYIHTIIYYFCKHFYISFRHRKTCKWKHYFTMTPFYSTRIVYSIHEWFYKMLGWQFMSLVSISHILGAPDRSLYIRHLLLFDGEN